MSGFEPPAVRFRYPEPSRLELTPGTDEQLRFSLQLVERGPFAIARELFAALPTLPTGQHVPPSAGETRDEALPLVFLGGRRTRPTPILVESDQRRVVVESEVLGLFATGQTYDEALQNLTEQVDMAAAQYASAPDSQLSPSGLRLKEKLTTLMSG